MSDLLGLGASGVRGYSRALETIGDNIANAQTAGFARRSVVLAEQVGTGQSVFYRNQVGPNGVVVSGVMRAVDPWLIEDARASASDAARSGARLGMLQAAEALIGDGGAGVGRAMTALFNRADELAADPSSAVRRNAFLGSVDTVAATFRRTVTGLAQAADGIGTAAAASVAQLNTDLIELVRVNDGLRRARDGSSNQASLLDERDRLVDAIAATLPVDMAYDVRGAAVLSSDVATMLAGGEVATVSVVAGSDGRLTLTMTSPAGSVALNPASGTLSGQIDAARHVATLREDIDAQAAAFATAINAQHAAGWDASGVAGAALLTGSRATDLMAVSLTAEGVAAADSSGVNGNALAFGNLRGSSGGEAGWAALVAQQSQAVATARAEHAVAGARRDGAAAARTDMSGVDLDREAAELVRFQQAYQASARVIQVARETMQTILDAL